MSRYIVGEVLAEGTRCVIRRAREVATGREVALKQPKDDFLKDPGGRLQFLRTATLTAHLEHPNVVPVHDLGDEPGDLPYYTMKMLHGFSLADVFSALAEAQPETMRDFPLSALLTIYQKVCDAVSFAHGAGTVHRNLAATDVMIGSFGEVRVLGWQMTTAADEAQGAAGRSDDLRALGAMLHELLTLQLARSSVVPVPMSGGLYHLPEGTTPPSLVAVAAKAAGTEAGSGYTKVEELQAEIRAYQSGFATAAENASLVRQLHLFVKRHWLASSAFAAGFSIILVFSTVYSVGVIQASRRTETEGEVARTALREADVETKRAKETLESLAASGPLFTSEAEQLIKERRFTEALEKLGYASDIGWNNPDYQLAYANLLQGSQRLAEAAAVYKRVLGLRSDPSAETNLRLTEQLLQENGDAPSLRRDLRIRLAEAIIEQGRSAVSPPEIFRIE